MIGAESAPVRARRARLWAGRLALMLGAAALSLVAAELVVRAVSRDPLVQLGQLRGMYAADGDGGVRTVGGFKTRFAVEGRPLTIALDSLGLRGPEPGPRRPGEKRVLVLGDSMTFGWGVAGDETFPSLLADRLTPRFPPRVVVGNAGCPGHSTVDEVRDLRRLRGPFAPDAVVVAVYTGNDFEENFLGPKAVIDGYWLGQGAANLVANQWRARLALRSRLAAVVERWLTDHAPWLAMDRSAYRPTEAEFTREAGLPEQRLHGLYMDAAEETPQLTRILDRMEASLVELRDLARPAPVLVAVIPSISHVVPGIYDLVLRQQCRFDPSLYRAGRAAERVAERCARLGIRCVDLRAGMAAHPEAKDLYLLADQHLSPAGHRVVAEQLAEPVAQLLSPP